MGYAEAPGSVCLEEGILDFALVAPGSGKEYESLFRVDCVPSHVHAALLALGARPGRIPEKFMGDQRGMPDSKAAEGRLGDCVRIQVRIEDDPKPVWLPIERWFIDRTTGKPPKTMTWVFTGSLFGRDHAGKEVYVADVEKLVAAVWYHGGCVLNLAAVAGSPYRGEKLGFQVHTGALPPPDAKLRFRFIVDKATVTVEEER